MTATAAAPAAVTEGVSMCLTRQDGPEKGETSASGGPCGRAVRKRERVGCASGSDVGEGATSGTHENPPFFRRRPSFTQVHAAGLAGMGPSLVPTSPSSSASLASVLPSRHSSHSGKGQKMISKQYDCVYFVLFLKLCTGQFPAPCLCMPGRTCPVFQARHSLCSTQDTPWDPRRTFLVF